MNIHAKLKELGIELPAVATPAANYVNYAITQGTLFVSGQLPLLNGTLAYHGKASLSALAQAQEAAQLCAINVLAQINDAVQGDWSKLDRVVRLGVFVNAESGFLDAHKVANGASDLIVAVLGDAGRHARAAVSVSELPLGAMVEVDAIVALKF